jgi:hypothetical protein
MTSSQYNIPLINQTGLNYNPIIRDADTTNPMLDTHFKLTFSRIPNMTFWCTSVNIPSISIGDIAIPNKFLPLHVPGSSIQEEDFKISFIVDEEFSNWNEIYKWMHQIVPFEDFTEILKNDANYYSDATIHCLNSAKRPNVNFVFHKLFPVSIDGFDLSTMLTDSSPITINATFSYESFSMMKAT